MITIVDYGRINLGSIQNMLKKVGAKHVRVVTTAEELVDSSQIILPGIGSFDFAMQELERRELIAPLREAALEKEVPFLGICLGMQLMTKSSEEGVLPGLGLVDGKCIRIERTQENLKIPHMGWNETRVVKDSKLISKEEKQRFYFVHSYKVVCDNREDILCEAWHGQPITAAFEVKNLIGAQFHPEKSHKFGMKLFSNFVNSYA